MADPTSGASDAGVWYLCGLNLTCWIDWMFNWQTIISGVLAVVAAFGGAFVVYRQMMQTERLERTRRAQRLRSLRARLPLHVSDLVGYAESNLDLLRTYLHAIGHPPVDWNGLAALPRPILPDQAIAALETAIENTDDPDFADYLADLISETQVLQARVGGMSEDSNFLSTMNLYDYMLNTAKVYAFAVGMFPYVRREADTPPRKIDWDDVIGLLRLQQMFVEEYPDLFAYFQRRRNAEAAAISPTQEA